MANNRMYIKCLMCGGVKMIAKYYPDTGWYFQCIGETPPSVEVKKEGQVTEMMEFLYDKTKNQNQDAFNEWIKDHNHGDYSFDGNTKFKLEFESDVNNG